MLSINVHASRARMVVIVTYVACGVNRSDRFGGTVLLCCKPMHKDQVVVSEQVFDKLADEIGVAGQRMVALGAAEGAAGNISVFVQQLAVDARYTDRGVIDLPVAVPALADGWVIVTGSARRLGDVARWPEQTLCVLHVQVGGEQAVLHAATAIKPTSELNSHLAIHQALVARDHLPLHAIVHAQPLRLTYLSHRVQYAEFGEFNRRLLRWQPETIMEFPDGIATLPFEVPGSLEQMAVTAEAMLHRRAVIWQKHGIVTRAPEVGKAADLVEYAEAAAQYEYLNLVAGDPPAGLSAEHIRRIAERLNLVQTMF